MISPKPPPQKKWWLSIFFAGSLLALGALFGSLSAVYLMDAVGRKASLLAFSVMSLFIGWTLLMAASQIWQLYTGRFLLGLGAGMEITICPVYIHETCRPYLRDVCGSFPQVRAFNNLNFRLMSSDVKYILENVGYFAYQKSRLNSWLVTKEIYIM